MIFFSIIIPVFNRADLICSTLDSIYSQEWDSLEIDDLEIIVVDDGSTDDTVKCLAKYSDRLTILHQENQGPGAARNLGIDRAQGDYILMLDSDDLWFPWSIDTLRKTIVKFDYPAWVAGTAVEFAELAELQKVSSQPWQTEFFTDYYASCAQPFWLLNGAVAIRTEVLRQAGGYTPKWINGEDSDLWLKLGAAQGFVLITSPQILAYYQHPNSAISNSQKTYAGVWHMIEQEQNNLYPGGQARQAERLQILLRHVRPVSLAYLRDGDLTNAWRIYQKTWRWNWASRRFVYLLGFWLMLIKAYLHNLSGRVLVIFKTDAQAEGKI